MNRRLLSGGLAALAVAATPPVLAAASTVSHAELWNNAGGTITCGLGNVGGRTGFLCSGGPKGYVTLGATGKAKRLTITLHTQPFIGTPPGARLAPGSIWRRGGITCRIAAKTVSCTNTSGHGFTVDAAGARLS